MSDLKVPVSSDWKIPQAELKSRRDFRKELVVSIDPATARDIDDCLSVRQLEDDLYEVGRLLAGHEKLVCISENDELTLLIVSATGRSPHSGCQLFHPSRL